MDLVLEDFNLDGFVDVLVRGLGSAITGELDRIVYAPGKKVGGYPVVLSAVDTDFLAFLRETSSWTRDRAYFENNAVSITSVQSSGFTSVYECVDDEPGNFYYTDYPCPFNHTEVGKVYEPFKDVVTVISYGNFNNDALDFARQFSLVDGHTSPDIALGSQSARDLNRILERVFGLEMLNGQLDATYTGSLAFDADEPIPCDNPAFIGRMLMGLVNFVFSEARAQTSAPITTQLPELTPGITGYGIDYPSEYADESGDVSYRIGQYGTTKTIEDVVELGQRWNMKYPNGPRILVGDISLENGADTPFHNTHENGRMLDIRPIRNDGGSGGLTWKSMTYDQEKTKELITEILKDENVEVIYLTTRRS